MSLRHLLHRPSVRLARLAQPAAAVQPFTATRLISSTPTLQGSKESLMDREAINTESREYSKSGGDGSSAAQEAAAFEPGRNDPEAERKKAGEGNDGNPLDVSPANQEISKPRPGTEGGNEGSPSGGERERASGGGSPRKAGTVSRG